MIRSVSASLLALLLASGVAFAQPAADAPKSDAPKADAPKTDAKPDAKPEAKPEKPAYEPQVGQSGKDVVWVPTPQSTVDRMLEMAALKPGDYLIDLGAGDGRTVITAAKRGIKALGIEYNPDMAELAKRNAIKEGVGETARIVRGDIFKTDFSRATVLTMYLLPTLNIKLRPTILKMKPGTRIVSHAFDMGDWEADGGSDNKGEACTQYCNVYSWIVPANAAGSWRIPQGRLKLEQKYQMLSGTLRTRDGKTLKIEDGRMRGEQITFTAGGTKYEGTVKGRKMRVKAVSAKA